MTMNKDPATEIMRREVFTAVMIGYCAKKAPEWNAEEDTVVNHMRNFINNLEKHVSEVEKVLCRNNRSTDEPRGPE